MQGKTIYAAEGETRRVQNRWAAEAEQRGATVTASDWEAAGGVSLGAKSLSGTTASVLATITACGSVKNTVTLSNGETLICWRTVEVLV